MRRKKQRWFVISFLSPALLIYAVLFVWPVIQAFYVSLFEWSGLSDVRKFVGLANFQHLIGDKVVWQALTHNMVFLLLGGVVMMVLALVIAHCLQGESGAAKTLRGIYLLPHIVSLVIVAVLWKFIYHPSMGMATTLVDGIGLKSPVWLNDKATALPSVVAAFVWYGLGFYTMLFSAGIRSIPQEVQEAADLDGATGWQRFCTVTWPLLWSVKRMSAIHLSIAAMNVFTLVSLMTNGGPSRRTEVMLTYLYEQAIQNSDYGYGTALAVLNLAVVLFVASIVYFVTRRDPTEARQ